MSHLMKNVMNRYSETKKPSSKIEYCEYYWLDIYFCAQVNKKKTKNHQRWYACK